MLTTHHWHMHLELLNSILNRESRTMSSISSPIRPSKSMEKVFFIPEIVWAVASYLPSKSDLCALTRTNKALHYTNIPLLYRDIEFSTFNVISIGNALRNNRTLSRYCRTLRVDLKGSPRKEERQAYGVLHKTAFRNPSYNTIIDQRMKILAELKYVIEQCSKHGDLIRISFDFSTGNDRSWLDDGVREWESFAWSKDTLQSLTFDLMHHKLSTSSMVSKHSC